MIEIARIRAIELYLDSGIENLDPVDQIRNQINYIPMNSIANRMMIKCRFI